MAKGKKRDDQGRFMKTDEGAEIEVFNPYVGGEEDDLSEMKYVQDAETVIENTHPPETKAEAEERAEMRKTLDEASEDDDDGVRTEESGEADEAEAEEEPGEEEEVVAEVEDEPEDDEPKIPKSRLDEVLEQKKREKERADKLEKQIEDLIEQKKRPSEPEPEPFDYAAKEKEAYDAFLEGDTEKYSAIQQEIREANKAELQREAKRIAAEGDQTVRDNLTFEETGAKIEAEYPALVKGDETFNEDAYSDLMDLYVGYVNTGRYSRADALQMAADKTVKIYQLKPVGKDLAADADDKDNVVNFKKKKPNLQKKKEVAEKQPPVKQGGTPREDEPTIDINSMSDEEFNALPESAKRRLRGDVL